MKLKDLLKENWKKGWSQLPAQKRWSIPFDKKSGLTEFEKKGGKDFYREGGPGSGPHGNGDEDNPFDKEPSDDDLANIEKEFEGVNEAKKIDSKTWKKMKYQIEDQIDDLVKIGEDYGVFQSAQYTAKTLKKIQKMWKSL